MTILISVILFFFVVGFQGNCDNDDKKEVPSTSKSPAANVEVTPVDPSLFLKENLLSEIATEDCTLSDGTKSTCYKVVVKGEPQEHKMGPWCPERIDDGKDKGGIWFRDGEIFDVDGKFIANLDKFYNDPVWKLYRDDGTVRVTKSQQACEAAAKPDVAEEFNNYCVECSPTFYKDFKTTYLIPITPIYKKNISQLGRRPPRGERPPRPPRGERPPPGRGGGGRGQPLGLALNGVRFDPPAPVDAILDAHTLAPLDDCGGHVNPNEGYHYHAAKGCTKEAEQKEKHSPLLGYALDGFGIYSRLDKEGNATEGLDQCGGHTVKNIGYHYHAGKPGDNQIIGCLHGAGGRVNVLK
ncbi:MAG: YHYH protein [Pyrinomonadaceae bacterium]|nr:YHYH protein [Pyrinomonadaceae bacterium]